MTGCLIFLSLLFQADRAVAELCSALQRPAANVGIWRRKLKSGRSSDALGKTFNEVEVFRGSRRIKQLFKKNSFTLIFKC